MQLSNNTQTYLCRFYEILDTMIKDMSDAPLIDSVSHNFITQMIPHHEGAIQMSKNALCFPICPELVPILEAIITSQEKEVRQMKCLLRQQ